MTLAIAIVCGLTIVATAAVVVFGGAYAMHLAEKRAKATEALRTLRANLDEGTRHADMALASVRSQAEELATMSSRVTRAVASVADMENEVAKLKRAGMRG